MKGDKRGFEFGVVTLVVIVLGVVLIVLGILFLTKIIELVPEEPEYTAPPHFETLVSPEKGAIGTIFKIRTSVPEDGKEYFVNVKIGEEWFVLYDDGKHGDLDVGDRIYAGVWDSSDFEVGIVEGFLSISDDENKQYTDSFSFEILENRCKVLLLNGNPEDKIDIVVIGQDYENLASFEQKALEYLDLEGANNGLFSYTPFKEEKSRFNLYMINDLLSSSDLGCEVGCKGVDSLVCCDDKKVFRETSDCPADEIVVLLNNEKFCGSASSYAKICTGGNRNSPMVLAHEFGHIFGGLGDEYDYGIYEGLEKIKDYDFPNCVSNCADWPEGVEAGCFETCGYKEYYRSVERNSIMYTYVPVFNPISIYYLNLLLGNYVAEKISEQELPAPSQTTNRKYISELVLEEDELRFEDVYVAIGESPDYKTVSKGYEMSIVSFDGARLYSSLFEIPQIIFPFFENETEDKPPAFFEEEVNYSLMAPYYEDAESMEIYDEKGVKVLEFDIGHLSESCGDDICDDYESYSDCAEDCDILEDEYCTNLPDDICDKDCPPGADPDCRDWKWIFIIAIVILVAVIVFFVIKSRKKPKIQSPKYPISYQ